MESVLFRLKVWYIGLVITKDSKENPGKFIKESSTLI